MQTSALITPTPDWVTNTVGGVLLLRIASFRMLLVPTLLETISFLKESVHNLHDHINNALIGIERTATFAQILY